MPPYSIGSADGSTVAYGFTSPGDVARVGRAVQAFENTRQQPPRSRAAPPRSSDLPLIPYYNASGYVIPPYGVVLINGSNAGFDYSPDVSQGPIPSVIRPDIYGCQYNALVSDAAYQYSISLAVDGVNGDGYDTPSFGAAQALPPFIAAYDNADGTPAANELWGPRSGTFLLKKNTGGFRVIGVYDSTNYYVLVWPEPMNTVFGKIASDCAPGATADLTVWTGAVGAEVTTGQTIAAVYNDSDCTIRATPKFATASIVPMRGGAWEFIVGRTA